MTKEVVRGKVDVLFFVKCLVFAYIMTGILLMLLAFLLYRLQLKEGIVSIGIILIYIAASFFSGFVTGKKMGSRKFLWGLLMGVLYFTVLSVVSLAVSRQVDDIAGSFVTALGICAGSGMLGGMLS